MGNKQPTLESAKMKAKEWQWKLKMEVKHLDKQIKKIEADEVKIRREIQAQAERGNVSSVQLMAKSIVKSKSAVKRLEKTKASMHAVDLQLTTSIATMSTTQSLRVSADCMKTMNALANLPELGGTMEEMRREMARCAEAEEGMEDIFRDEGEEELAALEIQKVLDEMALAKMGPLASTAAVSAPATAQAEAVAPAPVAAPPQRQLVAESAGPVAPPAPRPAAPAATAPPPAAAAPVSAAPPAAPVEPAAPPPAAAAAVAPPPAAAAAPPPAAPAPSPGGSEEDDLMARLQRLKKQ